MSLTFQTQIKVINLFDDNDFFCFWLALCSKKPVGDELYMELVRYYYEGSKDMIGRKPG